MERIKGKYYVKLHVDYGFAFPGDAGSRFQFWTDHVSYENDGSVTFEPINTSCKDEWPKTINIHISNCVIFKMKEN